MQLRTRLKLAGVLTLLSVAAIGAAQKTLIVSAANPTWTQEVRAKLIATGKITGDIDTFNAASDTPSLALLSAYDSVFVFSDSGFANNVALGNNLADFTDGGGGVVIGTFALSLTSSPLGLSGRIITGGYSPFTTGAQTQGSRRRLGHVYEPSHPIMQDVVSFDGGTSSFHNQVLVAAGAKRIADYDNGRAFVATRDFAGRAVVGLNFYPPSQDSRGDFWVKTTDGARLMAQAIIHSAGGIDNEPPVISGVPESITVAATSNAGAVVHYTMPTAIDNVDGPVTVTSSMPPGSVFPLGQTLVTFTAEDARGNVATETFVVTVEYTWSDFLQPLGRTNAFRAGSSIPVKFQLTGASAGVADASALLLVDGVVAGEFRYDSEADQYIYVWSTRGLRAGNYTLSVSLGDGATRAITVQLR
jgi:hypothetical protein